MPFRDHNPSGTFPIVTLSLIAANIGIFIYMLTLSSGDLDNFIANFALIPYLVDFSKPVTLTPFVTSMFLHSGLLHIGSNMLFLWVFGDNIEAFFGKIKYILFYFVGGITASLFEFFVIRDSTIPILGASGAIAAVLGSYLILFPKARVDILLPIFILPFIFSIPAYIMLAYWFVSQIFAGSASIVTNTSSIGGIAFFAHVGGFVFGIASAYLIRFLQKPLVKN